VWHRVAIGGAAEHFCQGPPNSAPRSASQMGSALIDGTVCQKDVGVLGESWLRRRHSRRWCAAEMVGISTPRVGPCPQLCGSCKLVPFCRRTEAGNGAASSITKSFYMTGRRCAQRTNKKPRVAARRRRSGEDIKRKSIWTHPSVARRRQLPGASATGGPTGSGERTAGGDLVAAFQHGRFACSRASH